MFIALAVCVIKGAVWMVTSFWVILELRCEVKANVQETLVEIATYVYLVAVADTDQGTRSVIPPLMQ